MCWTKYLNLCGLNNNSKFKPSTILTTFLSNFIQKLVELSIFFLKHKIESLFNLKKYSALYDFYVKNKSKKNRIMRYESGMG